MKVFRADLGGGGIRKEEGSGGFSIQIPLVGKIRDSKLPNPMSYSECISLYSLPGISK
jgi:hypothetical protein